jgi:ArsR family transcriptional regulator, nickel/cobalt-responsive transcriptional repressor
MRLIDGAAASLIADAMFALSAPSRVQILGSLLGGPLAVGDITDLLGMEQSAVSHQLRVLRELLTAASHVAGLGEPGDDSQRGKAAGIVGI